MCRLTAIVVAAMLLRCAPAASAQSIDLRLVDELPGGALYELTAPWPNSLRAALDSAQATEMTPDAALAVSRGGLFERTAFLRLPSLALPVVRVVAADFDEVHLPAAEIENSFLEALGGAPAEAVGLGITRRQAAATLVTRLVTYDREEETLRRYRKMEVRVEYLQGAPAHRAAGKSAHAEITESVLSGGTVFKLAFRTEGIFRIDRAFLTGLPGFSLSPGSIDPEDVKVYGNGGEPVPALNMTERPVDLVENPVLVTGGGDGSFDEVDAVWFYAKPPSGWKSVIQRDRRGNPLLDSEGRIIRHWEHYVHPFSNDNYYFIKIDDSESSAVREVAIPSDPGATFVEQPVGRFFLDFDEFMWARESPRGTGHTWVSFKLEDTGVEKPLLTDTALPGLSDGTLLYRVRAGVQSNPSATLYFKSGGTELASRNFGPVSNTSTNVIARNGVVEFDQPAARGAAVNLAIELESRPGSPSAAVDWVRVFYPRDLRSDGGHVRFHTPIGATGTFEMALTGFSSKPTVWDVTHPGDHHSLGVEQLGGAWRVQVAVTDVERPRELIAFTAAHVQAVDSESACPSEPGCSVVVQNLHGLQSHPDFLIVTPAAFRGQADELATIRRSEGLVVEVVDVQRIFNEFSGGLTDVRGIRDYIRFVYDRSMSEDDLLRYVLFFGDGHFNYRNIGAAENNFPNLIPPFETEESWNPELSYTTDDYFGLLDPDEGVWPFTRRTFSGSAEHLNERVDVGIGRLTVQTVEEAQVVLGKIKHYESPETYGPWRNRYLFVADDGPTGTAGQQNDRDLHTQNTDVVAEVVSDVAPTINQKKVYAISYQREFRNAWRVPGARQDLLQRIRDGVLAVNFSGHGSEEGLAQEDLFNQEDARTLQNLDHLPIFITATCSFGRWDRASSQSGAEDLLLNPDGGAIALLTTVRSVYTSGNATTLNVGLNVALNAELFRRDEDGLPRRLGDALRITKNTRVGFEGNNRKFNLLGDPSMRIGTAVGRAAVRTINDEEAGAEPLRMRALDRVTVKGEVVRPDGSVDTGFEGVVNMTVFDAERRVAIPHDMLRYMPTPYYTVREDLIWRGRVNASGGIFTANFVVPKDISYSDKPGRIALYAMSSSAHAHGYTENFTVGGTATDVPDDDEGPDIEIFLNDETFADGGLTTPDPKILVKLFDESGVNTVGAGVGHEMLLILDDDEQGAVSISDFYESDENSFQRGRVTYSFEEDLSSGPHTLTMRAWDVLNNSGSGTLDFVVAEDETLVLRNVFNYPNPTTGPTRFVFEHNRRAGSSARVQVRIYSLSGRPVRTVERDVILPGGSVQVEWDGRDDDLDRLSPGVYLYKVRVEVDGLDGDRQVSEVIERLAVIR